MEKKFCRELTIIIPLAPGKKIEGIKEIKNQTILTIPVFGTNPSKNRNLGVKHAKTRYIAFINGHTFLEKNWIKQVDKFFKKYSEVDIVGGPQLTSKEEGFFAKISGYALSSKFGAANSSSRYSVQKINLNADETLLTSANLICKKDVFKKIKFDENLYPGEDPKFISDAKKENFNVAYSPKIIVYNKRRTSAFKLIKQIFMYGFVRPKKENLIETIKKPFFLAPSLFLIYLIMLPILISLSKILILPLFFYFGLNIFFSIFEAIKNKSILSLFILPLLFVLIHLSYGAGFILGTINKSIKNKK